MKVAVKPNRVGAMMWDFAGAVGFIVFVFAVLSPLLLVP